MEIFVKLGIVLRYKVFKPSLVHFLMILFV